MISANFFCFVLYCTKRRCSQIKPQLKVEIEDGREAHKKPSVDIIQLQYLIIHWHLYRQLSSVPNTALKYKSASVLYR